MSFQLVIWNSESLIPVHVIPSLAGFVYSISITPLDPHKIVFGVGDNTVRVWSTGNGNNRYQSANFWQGIKTKVLVVASHPSKEGIFGFGTEDGHIGCGSWLSYKSDISASHHKKSVYSLSWGPCCSLEENNSEDKSLKGKCVYTFFLCRFFNALFHLILTHFLFWRPYSFLHHINLIFVQDVNDLLK